MASPSLSEIVISLAVRRRRWLLLALLVLLHIVLLQGPASIAGRLLFVVEIGLSILWQPFVRAERRLSPAAVFLIASLVAVAVFSLNWWMLACWIMLSAGIVGGKVLFYDSRWTKLFYLLALGDLAIALLLVVLPNTVPGVRLPPEVVGFVIYYLLPSLFAAMAMLPEEREPDGGSEAIDFIYAVFVFLLLAVLALGSLADMLLFGRGYAESLFDALLAVGLLLLALGWVWNPHAGFAGIGSVFSRYLLSIGLPVEQWLHTLADLADRVDDPRAFLNDACAELVGRLPWIQGGDWSDGAISGTFGLARGRRTDFRHGPLTLGIYTSHSLGPSLVWHFNLIAQLLGEFYADKLRARQLEQLVYVQAIHETGARLTHDMKNLLQSLNGLCAAAEAEADPPSPEFVALLRRQLPAIAQRLGGTLEKLRVPRDEGGDSAPAGPWFDGLAARYAAQGVSAERSAGTDDVPLPISLFSSVAENLLQNAVEKRRLDPRLTIGIRLDVAGGRAALEVTDGGRAIPPAVAAQLLHRPVASETGLGIGLYQAARQAEICGYRLSLAENRDGCVRFRLA